MPTLIHETAGTIVESTGPGRVLVKIIDEGVGSSGTYSAEVLEAAAHLFPPGVQMFIDHPTAAEDEARPVRSVKDLAAVTITPVCATAPVRPAASANGTVSPSDIPITMSRTVALAVK